MGNPLAAILTGYLAERGWSAARLARASGLSTRTISNWTTGKIRTVHRWQSLAQVARALELSRADADSLLAAGQQPSIEHVLAQDLPSEDRALLARWVRVNHAFSFEVPMPITRFIGREEEMKALTAMLAAEREVTVVGFGGYGKTRLALEAAHSMRHAFDGAYFIDLAAIHDPSAVIPTIAQTIGLRATPGEPLLPSLISWLRDARVLLVLDNVEQVLDAAPEVATLLRNTVAVKVLVTSRIPIDIQGEHVFSIDPLPLPPTGVSYAALRQNPAVLLFTDRAKGRDRHLGLTARTAPIIANICRRLDGMPLAIELAAARTRGVPLAELFSHFPTRMEIASSGPRDVDARQRTLRATIAWSFDLLDADAQHLFALLGVFAGGFTREAAITIGASAGLAADTVEHALDSLTVHQFVREDSGQSGGVGDRFMMLETIREDARNRLRDSSVWGATLRAHAQYFIALGERAEMNGAEQPHWLAILAAERDNVRAALDWCRANDEREAGLRLCLANMPLWELREPGMESYARLRAFMAGPERGEIAPVQWARGLVYQGLFLMRANGDLDAASGRFAEALVIFRDARDIEGMCRTLQAIGDVGRYRQQWDSASDLYRESLALAKQIGSTYLVAHGYMGLAFCAQEQPEKMDMAERYASLTLEWAERSGHRPTIAQAANSMGEMARYHNDWRRAVRYYERALTVAREISNTFREAMVLHNLGYAALGVGDSRLARSRFMESLHLYERMRDRKGMAECLAGLAKTEITGGDPKRAAALCGASQAMLDALHARLDTMDQADFDRTIAALHERFGARLETLLAEGRTMPIAVLLG